MNDSKKIISLEEKAKLNKELFNEKPEVALYEIDELIKEAEKQNNQNLELKLIMRKCEYNYFFQTDFEKMINSAKELQKQAQNYSNPFYEARSHIYLSQAYSFNKLFDKSLKELQAGLNVLDNAVQTDSILLERGNIYGGFANIYNFKKEYFNTIRVLHNALYEHQKLKDDKLKKFTLYVDYANLGGAFLEVNHDSAEYYALKSLNLLQEKNKSHFQTFLDYITLATVYSKREDYDKALNYLKKAEYIQDNTYHINLIEMYKIFIKIYEDLGQQELKNEYEAKLKDLKLQVAENESASLRKLVKEQEETGIVNQDKDFFSYSWILILFLLLIIMILLTRSNRNKITKEKIALSPGNYLNLKQLLQTDKQAFLLAFDYEFPGLIDKIRKIEPEFSESEIEMLIMIKLKLSISEIAKYLDIQVKTAQNKRHLIRTKLHLETIEDLEDWLKKL